MTEKALTSDLKTVWFLTECCLFERGVSYYGEVLSVIEDAVEFGFAAGSVHETKSNEAHEHYQPQIDEQIAENNRLREFLQLWIYEGRLQSFEDRERFRHEAKALLWGDSPPSQETGKDECQHDLLKPGTTIEVIDPWKAKCKVCVTFFDLPGRPAPKASTPQPGDVLGTARMVYTGKLPPREVEPPVDEPPELL